MTNPSPKRELPFWSDDFDMDLLKVFPDICELLGATVTVPIFTLSRTTYERLNCPCSWNTYNGLTSFLWLEKPDLPRDRSGWVSVGACVANESEVEGTWLEWLRDAWVHDHNWILLPHGDRFSGVDYNRCFYPIMAHRRGWRQEPQIENAYKMARLWLTKANRRFANAVERHRLKRGDDYPCLSPMREREEGA